MARSFLQPPPRRGDADDDVEQGPVAPDKKTGIQKYRAVSSAGQSACLTSMMPLVRIQYRPPFFLAKAPGKSGVFA